MRKVLGAIFSVAMLFSVVFVADNVTANAQTTVKRKRPVRGVVSGSKYIYRKGKGGVTYVYRKSAKGVTYVGKKGYKGGKYVTGKTVKGTKSIFSNTKRVVTN